MKNVLVTGGAGYIGSHVCKELAKQGFNPITYDNLSNGYKDFVKWGLLEVGDIQDTERLCGVLKAHKIEAVIHLAAYAYVGESVLYPSKYYWNNVVGSLSLLEAMMWCDVKKIIFSSSCATYGIPEIIPITEDQPQNPISPYGNSKLLVEKILNDYVNAYGFQAACLRYFNAAGADSDGEIGELHNPETHIIPLVCQAALGKIDCIKVFGSDYETLDGTCIRDYTHVSDLAIAHVKALSFLDNPNNKYDAFNIGTGIGYSVLDIINVVEKVSNKKIKVVLENRREGDVASLISDTSRAKNELDWSAIYNLDDIVRSSWKFLSSKNY